MITVDRDSFIAFTRGVLLDRDRECRVLVGDDMRNQLAVAALERGETVRLKSGDRVVSEVREINGVFTEYEMGEK
jgi:hypothetical protein